MNRRWVWVIGALLVGLGLFGGAAALSVGKLGFPLDDAWIHQTYARNLVRYGRFEYVPGLVSSGSTAPLWTLLLAVGYALRLPYLVWTYLLGGLSLLWLAGAVMQAWALLWPTEAEKSWLPGLVTVLLWPLLWAAASGMETLLFAALGMQLFVVYGRLVQTDTAVKMRWSQIGLLGLLAGALVLTRPDGLGLILLVVTGLFLLKRPLPVRVGYVLGMVGTAVACLAPYFWFNWQSSGTIWPNTLYAKQIEYAVLLERPLPLRFLELLYLSLGGAADTWQGMSSAHLLLLPGILAAGWSAVKRDWQEKHLLQTVLLLWAGGHVLLYAWRLPATYQHGRYLMAIMPVWILFGLAGWRMILFRPERNGRVWWYAQTIGRLTFAIVLAFFLLQGAVAYARDVSVIEGEMVAVAHWLAENTPAQATIAAHDIGAIGYFAERPLIDLAGLITPEIIPILNDEPSLAAYVLYAQADYLVTAPGWEYAVLVNRPDTQLRYQTNVAITQESGLNGTAVYQLSTP